MLNVSKIAHEAQPPAAQRVEKAQSGSTSTLARRYLMSKLRVVEDDLVQTEESVRKERDAALV